MAKLVPSAKANDLVGSVFKAAKSRSTFSVDFQTLDRESKAAYVSAFYGNEVFYHQKEQVDVLTNPYIRSTTINASRQTGKGQIFAWCQGLAAIHNLYPSLDKTTKVISLANKESQALIVANRLRSLLERNWAHTQFFWDRVGSTKTNLVFKREAGVNTTLMGTIQYMTANPNAFSEGMTGSILFIDEAGRLDQKVFSEVVTPFGGSTAAPIILAGVSRGKGPFYDACNSKDYTHLHFPWDKVETYRKPAPVDLVDYTTGEVILETGIFPLDIMPLSLKKILFPKNPWCHIYESRGYKERWVRLWDLSEGKMAEEDFRSQYMLEWVAALMAILQLEHVRQIFESSDFLPPDGGQDGEEYYYGFDLGGARNVYARGPSNKDTAALSIWTRRNGIKCKVFCEELYSAQPQEAVDWLLHWVHPSFGVFPCKYGAVDVTGALGAFTSEYLVKSKLPVIPIFYNRVEETTKKNYKNAMFDYFKIEAAGGRIQYPSKIITDALDEDTLQPKFPVWNKAREQWEIIEKKDTGGNNAQISAPSTEHDDHPNSDVLCVFVMDRPQQFEDVLPKKKRRLVPLRSPGLGVGFGFGGTR